MSAVLEFLGKLRQRKFLLPVVTCILVSLNDVMEWGLDEQTIDWIVKLVIGFVIAEGAVDTARAYSGGH